MKLKGEASEAEAYAALYCGSTPASQFFHQRLDRVLDCLNVLPGGRVLDVGCGPGILLDVLDDAKFERHGIDCSLGMVRQARAIAQNGQTFLSVAQLEYLPYPDQTFDVVLALGVLEYLPELGTGLSEISRVARPNALVIISMLNSRSLYWQWRRHVWDAVARRWSSVTGRSKPLEELIIRSRRQLIGDMKRAQIAPQSVIYYDFNIGIEPLSTRFPRIVRKLNSILESWFGRRLYTVLRTAFLIIAISSS